MKSEDHIKRESEAPLSIDEKTKWALVMWGKHEEQINSADLKATINLGICSALFAGLALVYSFSNTDYKSLQLCARIAFIIFGTLSIISIAITLIATLFIYRPRTDTNIETMDKDRGMGYFVYIARMFRSPLDMLNNEVMGFTKERLIRIYTHQVYILAKLADEKMKWAGWSTWSTISAVVFSAINYALILWISIL